MKKIKLIAVVFSFFTMVACSAQKSEMKNIESTINQFVKAGDNSDAKKLATYLDDNFRVVMNRLFGSDQVATMEKSVYLEKIRSKEFGGDNRTVEIENILINGSTASAKVNLKGSKMTFISLLTLVQGADGNWKIIADTPMVG